MAKNTTPSPLRILPILHSQVFSSPTLSSQECTRVELSENLSRAVTDVPSQFTVRSRTLTGPTPQEAVGGHRRRLASRIYIYYISEASHRRAGIPLNLASIWQAR
ncbi:unnamed protein product [Ectocarpus sp. CCAP 1310/34]|nr:unnamed protein product [Ectocarpus sp. CCAP 1310/34]